MDVSIVIVNWNTKQLLLDCLASVYSTLKNVSFEIWLVDNASSDGSVETVESVYPDVNIIQNQENLGFAAANNKALRKIAGRYTLLLNTDTVLSEGAIEKLFSFMEDNPETGMACGQLLNEDGTKQNSIANFPSFLSLLCNETILRIFWPKRYPSKRQEYKEPIEVESCIGACLMVRKKAIDEVGFLDERYFFFMEETDWALSMRKAGWKSCFIPDAWIYHLQGQSTGHNVEARKMFYRSRYQYFKKWFPRTCLFLVSIVVFRLLINFLLNAIGVIFTLSFNERIKAKSIVYGKLINWHLQGCPKN